MPFEIASAEIAATLRSGALKGRCARASHPIASHQERWTRIRGAYFATFPPGDRFAALVRTMREAGDIRSSLLPDFKRKTIAAELAAAAWGNSPDGGLARAMAAVRSLGNVARYDMPGWEITRDTGTAWCGPTRARRSAGGYRLTATYPARFDAKSARDSTLPASNGNDGRQRPMTVCVSPRCRCPLRSWTCRYAGSPQRAPSAGGDRSLRGSRGALAVIPGKNGGKG